MTSVIKNLTDFEELLVIAKRHGLTQFRLGDIEVLMPVTYPDAKPEYSAPESKSMEDLNAEVFNTFQTL